MHFQYHTLSNGIRLIHLRISGLVAHYGFFTHTGSRDELPLEHGMAHFIEHVVFKGTKKRKAWHILSRLEDAGGEINAYTTKEDTCVHASFLKNDLERAAELIYDICFHSVFPEKEIAKEKHIIIDEILSYKDSPYDLIFDEFEELIYNNHPIGRTILGNEKSLLSFTKNDIIRFIVDNYSTKEMVISSVGDYSFEKSKKIAEKYFGQLKEKTRVRPRISPSNYTPQVIHTRKNTHQVHCMLGNIAFDARDQRRFSLSLLNNILGGPGLNSRLNMSLREKSGLSYNVESQYNTYSDTGVLTVYFGCDTEHYEKSLDLIFREFRLLREKKLGSLQLSKAKKQLFGQVCISSESNEHLMLSMGKSTLMYNHKDSLEEIQAKIEAIQPEEILETANIVLDKNMISILQYH